MAVGARPFLIAYNINLDSRDLELAKRIARRIRESSGGLPRVQANGFWIEELDRAQVSMNLLDYRTTPIWHVWEVRSRGGGRGRRPPGRVRADRAGAARGAAGRGRPRRRARATAAGRASRRSGGVPEAARLLADAGARAAARGRTRSLTRCPGQSDAAAAPRPADRGRRVDRHAGRRAAARRRTGRRGGAQWRFSDRGDVGGSDRRRGARRGGPPPDRGRGPFPRRLRPHRRRRLPGHARADRRPYAPRLRRDPRDGVADAVPRRGLPGDPRRRAAGSSRRSPPRVPPPTRSCSPGRAAAWPRCWPAARQPPRPSPATGSTSRRSCGCSRRSAGSIGRARFSSCRRSSAPTPSPPSSAAAPTAPGAYVADVVGEQLPAVARQGIARFCDVFCEEGVFDARQSRQILSAASQGGPVGSHPRRRAGSFGRRRARGRAGLRLRRPPRGAVGGGNRRAGPGRRGGHSGRGHAAAGHELVPRHAPFRPGAPLHRRGHPRRAGHGPQPGHEPDGGPAAGDVDRLRGDGPDAGRGARGGHDQCGPLGRLGRRAWIDRAGQAGRPGRLGRTVARPRSPTGSAVDTPEPSSSAAGRYSETVDRSRSMLSVARPPGRSSSAARSSARPFGAGSGSCPGVSCRSLV